MKVKIGSSAADRRPQKYQTTDPYKLTPFEIEEAAAEPLVWIIYFILIVCTGLIAWEPWA